MEDEPQSTKSLVEAANFCLGCSGRIEVVKLYQFHDDFDAHDDSLQESLAREFDMTFAAMVDTLAREFGQPPLPEDDEEFAAAPVSGANRAAFWNRGDKALFLAEFHEDRECPFVILVGSI